MALGNVRRGLLKELVDLARELGGEKRHDSDRRAAVLKGRGYWHGRKAETPERTVNSYLSQNPHVFEHVGRNSYRLERAYWCAK